MPAGIEAARYLRTGKMSGFANQQFRKGRQRTTMRCQNSSQAKDAIRSRLSAVRHAETVVVERRTIRRRQLTSAMYEKLQEWNKMFGKEGYLPWRQFRGWCRRKEKARDTTVIVAAYCYRRRYKEGGKRNPQKRGTPVIR